MDATGEERKIDDGEQTNSTSAPDNIATDSGDSSSIESLSDLVDRLQKSTQDRDEVRLEDVIDEIGRRSFVPLLLAGGTIMAAPVVGAIPGVPIVAGLCIALVAVQMVFNRQRFWMPGWLERQEVSSEKLSTAVTWIRKPAGWIDRLTKPRMQWVVRNAGQTWMAVACLLIALTAPVMELIPFSANVAGLAVLAFSLSLLVGDGLIGLVASGLFLALIAVGGIHLFG